MGKAHERLPPCGAKTRAGSPCRRPAGHGTSHPGQGRCKLHGGKSPVTHGRYSVIRRPSVQQRIDELKAADAEPLDLLEELHLLRALTIDFIERYDVALEDDRPRQRLDIADASRLIERIARVVEIIHKTQQEHTISLETFRRLMEQMALAVTRYVSDGDTLRAIETAWGQIRVEPSHRDRR
jgi:hypothetical protein